MDSSEICARLELLAAWRKPGGPTPAEKMPGTYKTVIAALAHIRALETELEMWKQSEATASRQHDKREREVGKALAHIRAQDARIKRLEEALKDALEELSGVAMPSLLDPDYSDEIQRLGDRIGYGALMHGASALWRHILQGKGGAGGEFVVGPCQSTASKALDNARAALEETHDRG